MPYDAFISYSPNNSGKMTDILNRLENGKLTVWVDIHIGAGTQRDIAIKQAIKESNCVVVLLSPETQNYPPVTNEILYALECSKRIIPVLIDGDFDCIPLDLRRLQPLDLRKKSFAREINKLINLIKLPSQSAVPQQLPHLSVFRRTVSTLTQSVPYQKLLSPLRWASKHPELTLGIIALIVTIIFGLIQSLPEENRTNLLIAFGLIEATPTTVASLASPEITYLAPTLFSSNFTPEGEVTLIHTPSPTSVAVVESTPDLQNTPSPDITVTTDESSNIVALSSQVPTVVSTVSIPLTECPLSSPSEGMTLILLDNCNGIFIDTQRVTLNQFARFRNPMEGGVISAENTGAGEWWTTNGRNWLIIKMHEELQAITKESDNPQPVLAYEAHAYCRWRMKSLSARLPYGEEWRASIKSNSDLIADSENEFVIVESNPESDTYQYGLISTVDAPSTDPLTSEMLERKSAYFRCALPVNPPQGK